MGCTMAMSPETEVHNVGTTSSHNCHRTRSMPSIPKKPKILFVATEDWYFLSHRLSLACAARDAGLEVSVATSPGRLRHLIEKEGFKFLPLHFHRNNKNPVIEILSIAHLISIYKRLSPDVIHHIALKPVLYGSFAARLAGCTSIVNAITGLGHTFTESGSHKRFLRNIMMLSCRLIISHPKLRTLFQNPDDRDMFIRKGIVEKSGSCLIPGAGVDTCKFKSSSEIAGPATILLPARMIWDKGISELVQAARILRARGADFCVLLAGRLDTGNPTAIPESQLRAWEQEGLVQWLGNVADMPTLYARCHIICLPTSYREGIPLALIEAASCGRPIVTTDAPGCREIVRHNHNGILVPVRNVELLVQALHTLIVNPKMRIEMGRRSRELAVEQFSKKIVISQTLGVYQEMLGNRWPCQKTSW